MLHIDLTLEDTRIVATRLEKWNGTITDALKGVVAPISWTDKQIGAIVALALGGDTIFDDKGESEHTKALYSIAEDAILGLPIECRPIP